MKLIEPWELRARFARALSQMYGREVPAYQTLVEVCHAINAEVVRAAGADAERLGSLERVTAERHGAIRVGTPAELAQVARIFGAMGMVPVGFYDLRDAVPNPVPVVSTAFRAVDPVELERNPFRVFTSLLAVSDRRFFPAGLRRRLEAFLDERELFPAALLALADRAEAQHGLTTAEADQFVASATRAFELSREPIDGAWYRELERISAVAADIGGVASTHVNHLTPRVLDIDELYARMTERGIVMIDAIQGPPCWNGPDVLLRQTSFRALAEPRRLRRADGTVTDASLRVRFGEVEARGIALTAAGRARYDELDGEVAAARAADPGADAGAVAARVWEARFPGTERALGTPIWRSSRTRSLRLAGRTVTRRPPTSPGCSTAAGSPRGRSSMRTSFPARPRGSSSPISPPRGRTTTHSTAPSWTRHGSPGRSNANSRTRSPSTPPSGGARSTASARRSTSTPTFSSGADQRCPPHRPRRR